MKNLDRKVTLLCPLCGNDQFESLDEEFEDLLHASARFDGDVGIMIMDREKQPFEELEARKSYELILITHNGSASKFRIITEWTDSSGKQHTKTQMGDFS